MSPNGSSEPAPQELPLQVPRISGIAVHWGEREPLEELLAAWPRDPRFELVVVDNAGTPDLELPAGCAGRVLAPAANLGFAGGVNAGVAAAQGQWLLILNSDVVPHPGALEALVSGFERWEATCAEGSAGEDPPSVGGLVPRLESPAGDGQWRWQLRDLPTGAELLLHLLFVPVGDRRSAEEPAPGEPIQQPAAAALALTREALEAVGGLDESFYPAWFEDVDFARRLRDRGFLLRYHPAARFGHRLGSSVASLGYGPFLWIYSKNLVRYLGKHHGTGWRVAARWLLPVAALVRLLLVPVRRPRRAATRARAAAGLLGVLAGALTGWRLPRTWAASYRAPARES